jgi:hypothetical protein
MIFPKRLWRGIHVPEHKEQTCHLPIRRLPFAPLLVVPFSQHTGALPSPSSAKAKRSSAANQSPMPVDSSPSPCTLPRLAESNASPLPRPLAAT